MSGCAVPVKKFTCSHDVQQRLISTVREQRYREKWEWVCRPGPGMGEVGTGSTRVIPALSNVKLMVQSANVRHRQPSDGLL